MLNESRDVLVARDRVAGASAIATNGTHDVIIMDEGEEGATTPDSDDDDDDTVGVT